MDRVTLSNVTISQLIESQRDREEFNALVGRLNALVGAEKVDVGNKKPYFNLLKHITELMVKCNNNNKLDTHLQSIQDYLLSDKESIKRKSVEATILLIYVKLNNFSGAQTFIENRINTVSNLQNNNNNNNTIDVNDKLVRRIQGFMSKYQMVKAMQSRHEEEIQYRQLPKNNINNLKSFGYHLAPLDILKSKVIKQISQSRELTAILYDDGTVMQNRFNEEARCLNIGTIPIVQIESSRSITIGLSSNGQLYSWPYDGNDSFVNHGLLGSGYKQISAGHQHFAAVKTNGDVYTWGTGANGRCGQGLTDVRQKVPKKVEWFNNGGKRVATKVVCGRAHTAVLTTDGQVYTFGWNHRFQLGYDLAQVPCRKDIVYRTNDSFIPYSTYENCFHPLCKSEKYSDISVEIDDGALFTTVPLHFIAMVRVNPQLSPLLDRLKEAMKGGEKKDAPEYQLNFKQNKIVPLVEFLGYVNLVNGKHETLAGSIAEIRSKGAIGSYAFNEFIRLLYSSNMPYFDLKYRSSINALCDAFGGNYCAQVKKNLSDGSKSNTFGPFPATFYGSKLLSDIDIVILKHKEKTNPEAIGITLSADSSTTPVKTIPSHFMILETRMEYFKALVATEKTLPKQVYITIGANDKVEVVEDVLKYLYFDTFKFDQAVTTGDYILDMIKMTNGLGVSRLKAACEKLVIHSVDKNNVFGLMLFGQKNNAVNLLNYTTDFINNNKEQFPDELVAKLHWDIQHMIYKRSNQLSLEGGQYLPRLVEKLKDKFIVDIAAGDKLTLAYDDQNNIYQLGIGSIKKNDLSHFKVFNVNLTSNSDPNNNNNNNNNPNNNNATTNQNIRSIDCGSSHGAVLLENGELYGWGTSFLGQLGVVNKFIMDPIQVNINGEVSANPASQNNVKVTTEKNGDGTKFNRINCGPYTSSLYYEYNEELIEDDTVEEEKEVATEVDESLFTTPTNNDVLVRVYEPFSSISPTTLESLTLNSSSSGESTASSTATGETSTKQFVIVDLYFKSENLPKPVQSQLIQEGSQKTLKIYGFSKSIVLHLLKYLTVTASPLKVQGDEVLDLLRLANYLNIKPLSKKLVHIVTKNLTTELAISIYQKYIRSKYSVADPLIPIPLVSSVRNSISQDIRNSSKLLF